MYPPELEAYFNKHIEYPANQVFDRVYARHALTDADRATLVRYITALLCRVPEGRSRASRHLAGLIPNQRLLWNLALDKNIADDPDLKEKVELLRLTLNNHFKEFEQSEEKANEVWKAMLTKELQLLGASILNLDWTFLIAESTQVITSDNPVYVSPQGIAAPDGELFFPISRHVALLVGRLGNRVPLYSRATHQQIRKINAVTAYKATRFVFAATNERWVSSLVEKTRSNSG